MTLSLIVSSQQELSVVGDHYEPLVTPLAPVLLTRQSGGSVLLRAVFTHPKRLSGSRQAHTGTSAVTALIQAPLLVAVRPISAASRSRAPLQTRGQTFTPFDGDQLESLLKTD